MSRLSKSSTKACFAQQAVTKKKCTARIVRNNVPTAAPTYTGLMVNYKKNQNNVMQFFFCNDDIERRVKGTKRKWVISMLEIPAIWPVKRGKICQNTKFWHWRLLDSNSPSGRLFCRGDCLANTVGFTCYHPIQSLTKQMSIPRFEEVRGFVEIRNPRQRCKQITLHLRGHLLHALRKLPWSPILDMVALCP